MSFDNLDSTIQDLQNYDGLPLLGVVIDNNDPLNLSRVKVRIPGLFDPDNGEVPWVGPLKFAPFGMGASWGVYGSPAIGSAVAVYLQRGNPQYPLYLSVHRQANGEFPAGKAWGFVDPVGNKVKFDLVDKSITLTTNDSIVFRTDGQGNLSVTVPGKTDFVSEGDTTLTSNAKLKLKASSSIDLEAPTLNIQANTESTGTLKNNGKDVGSTHRHGGISVGGSNTSPPV